MHDDVKKKINSNRSLNNSGDLKIENRMSVSNNHGQRLHQVNILKIAQLCSFQTYEKTTQNLEYSKKNHVNYFKQN